MPHFLANETFFDFLFETFGSGFAKPSVEIGHPD